MSVTYVEQVPYGYSKNSYPAKSNQPTHRIVSRAPVYDAYSTSYVEHDVGQDQDRKGDLIVILDPGEEVVVYNHYLGHNAEWREITVVGRTYEAKNLFVHSSFIESIARENLPPVTYVNKIESRDYSLSNLIWHTRQKDASYYDSSYAKYFVKVDLQYEIHPEDSLNKNLEKALVRGTRLILEQNEKQVPNDLNVEWCLQYDHFFEVFDFTLEMRSEEYKRLIALVGIDQKYFLPLPQNLAQLPREYSQPSEFEYLTDFYERYPEKRTTPAPDVASNYRRLDLFLDQNNGILNLDRVTENMCAIDPRWCEYKNLDFEVRGNKIEFNWSKPIFASQVSIEESRIYQNQIEKTINYQSQKLVDDFFSDNEYTNKASGFLESTRNALANFNSGTNDLFNAIESLTLALDNAPPIDETTAGALSALSNPSTAADLFQPQAVVDESLQDIVDFYNQTTTYKKIDGNYPSDSFYKYYYLKEFTNLRYIRVLPFNNKKDFIDSKIKLQDIFNELQKLKDDYEGKVYNFDPGEDYKNISRLFNLIEGALNSQENPFTVEIHYNSEYRPIFLYIKQSGITSGTFKVPQFGSTLEIVMSRYDLQQKRISYYTLELLDIINKGLPSDIKLWTDEFTRFPNVEYVPRFKNIARKEKQLRRGKRNQFVINNVLKKEEDESLNDLGKLVSDSLAAQEYVANSVDTAIQVTDDLINDINTIDDAFDKYLDKQAVDNPILIATLRCLIPQIDLAILPETDEVEIIREAIQTVELALETYDSLNKGVAMSLKRLGIPTSGDSSGDAYQKAFEILGEKAMNLAYAIAVKKALQIVQALCLQAQKFILDLLLALLSGSDEERPDMNKILRTGDQAFPQPGPGQSPQIGAFQRASTGGSIGSSPDPEELQKFFNDVANILSPIEFCTMFSRQTTPSYILDIAFNFLTTKYENTLLPNIRNRGELAAVIKSLSDFIDRDMCDQLAAQYQIPTEGYSHTRILCEDTNRLRNDLLAESFGIELSEIESIVANQNQSNMSLLRDTMNSLQQPNEQVVDIYAQVRDTPEAKEYFHDSPLPDVESLFLQDINKIKEFIDDTRSVTAKTQDLSQIKGFFIGDYQNGKFYFDNPTEPYDPFSIENQYRYLPFNTFRPPLDNDIDDLDEINKRQYVEDIFRYYSATSMYLTSIDLMDENRIINTSDYMEEEIFSYLNTALTYPLSTVNIEKIHERQEEFNETSDLNELTYYSSDENTEVSVYEYQVKRPEKSSFWEYVSIAVGVVVGSVAAILTAGAASPLLLLAWGTLGGVVGGLGGWGTAKAWAHWGNPVLQKLIQFFSQNDDMPNISNIKYKKFLDSDWSSEQFNDSVTYTNLLTKTESPWPEHLQKYEDNLYHEINFYDNDKRYFFPSAKEMFSSRNKPGIKFEANISTDGHIEIRNKRIYTISNVDTSHELLGCSGISAPIEEEIEIDLDNNFTSYPIRLRDPFGGKYYSQDPIDLFKEQYGRFLNRHSFIDIEVDQENNSIALFYEDNLDFNVTNDSGMKEKIRKKSKIEISNTDLSKIDLASEILYEQIIQNPQNYLSDIILAELWEDNKELVKEKLFLEIRGNFLKIFMSKLQYEVSREKILELLTNKELSINYRNMFQNSAEIFSLENTYDYNYLYQKFSSGFSAIDNNVGGQDLSVGEKIQLYYESMYFLKTFVVEYMIKIFPFISKNGVSDNFEELSSKIIYKQFYRFLEMNESQTFKYKLVFNLNAFYYFFNQQDCIDVNMEDPNFAILKIIKSELKNTIEKMTNQGLIQEDESKEIKNDFTTVMLYDIPNFDSLFYGSTSQNLDLPLEYVEDTSKSNYNQNTLEFMGIRTSDKTKTRPKYSDSISVASSNIFQNTGIIYHKPTFKVYFEDGVKSYTPQELHEIFRPYSKYKVDNLRIPTNLLKIDNLSVPFVSSNRIGHWKNTMADDGTFRNLFYVYDERYLEFLSIKKIELTLVPVICNPFASKYKVSGVSPYSYISEKDSEDILSNITGDIKVEDYEIKDQLSEFFDKNNCNINNFNDNYSSLLETNKPAYFDNLSYHLSKPVYEKEKLFELSKTEAENMIESLFSQEKITKIVSELSKEAENNNSFYRHLSEINTIDSSIMIPIIHDFMENYVLHQDMLNFKSVRDYIIDSSVQDFSNTNVAQEILEKKFGEIIADQRSTVESLTDHWRKIKVVYETDSEQNAGLDDSIGYSSRVFYDIDRDLPSNEKFRQNIPDNTSTGAPVVFPIQRVSILSAFESDYFTSLSNNRGPLFRLGSEVDIYNDFDRSFMINDDGRYNLSTSIPMSSTENIEIYYNNRSKTLKPFEIPAKLIQGTMKIEERDTQPSTSIHKWNLYDESTGENLSYFSWIEKHYGIDTSNMISKVYNINKKIKYSNKNIIPFYNEQDEYYNSILTEGFFSITPFGTPHTVISKTKDVRRKEFKGSMFNEPLELYADSRFLKYGNLNHSGLSFLGYIEGVHYDSHPEFWGDPDQKDFWEPTLEYLFYYSSRAGVQREQPPSSDLEDWQQQQDY